MAAMRLKASVSYDGSTYSGWQRQANVRSIQAVIEDMLTRLHKQPIEIVASGRTDAHVHAVGQVFHFDTSLTMNEENWCQAMNCMLPMDIRIQKVEFVTDTFHARFSATSKRYDYLVTTNINNPFVQNYMGKTRQILDIPYMKECATLFLGSHDFTSFTSAKIDPRKPRTKCITRLEVIQEGDAVRFIFEGNGFLRYMVRILAQTIIEAGKHKISKDDVSNMLERKDKNVCHYKADACGLYLMEVHYGGEESEG